MAAQGSELYYIIFLLSSKHDNFYFDYSAANCIALLFHCEEYFRIHLITAIKELIEEVIRGITPGDWAKCVQPVLSEVRVYILVKGDRGRGRS